MEFISNNVKDILGKTLESNNCGKFKVISHFRKNNRNYYKIEFLNTGNISIARRDNIKIGNVGDINMKDIVGSIVESNNYGKVKILKYIGKKEDNRHYYKVKFLNSGNVLTKERNYIKKGIIADDTITDIIGRIFDSLNCGKFKVLNFHSKNDNYSNYYEVEFLKTGYKTLASKSHIKSGEVKDRLFNNGAGCIGFANQVDNQREYMIWKAMLSRCYDKNDAAYKYYGLKGVTVYERWHRFDFFLEDMVKLPSWDKNKFYNNELELDKDKLQFDLPHNERVYSKETCCWLTKEENLLYRS